MTTPMLKLAGEDTLYRAYLRGKSSRGTWGIRNDGQAMLKINAIFGVFGFRFLERNSSKSNVRCPTSLAVGDSSQHLSVVAPPNYWKYRATRWAQCLRNENRSSLKEYHVRIVAKSMGSVRPQYNCIVIRYSWISLGTHSNWEGDT